MAIEVLAISGTDVTAAALRLAGFFATKGGSGVALPTDLQVRDLNVPGGAVQIVRGPSGGAAIPVKAASASAQSYLTVTTATEELAVPATGSAGGATRYVIQYVEDPQFDGQAPQAGFAVTSNPATYPHSNIVLARIDQPASTATITQDLITDLRVVANPRMWIEMRPRMTLSSEAEVMDETRTNGGWFPNAGGEQLILIPEGATKAVIKGEWLDVRYAAGSNPSGQHWVEFGPGVGGFGGYQDRARSTQRGQHDATAAGNTDRRNWFVRDVVDIPEDWWGTTQTFVLKARTNGDPGASIDGLSGVNLEVIFQEVATPSSS